MNPIKSSRYGTPGFEPEKNRIILQTNKNKILHPGFIPSPIGKETQAEIDRIMAEHQNAISGKNAKLAKLEHMTFAPIAEQSA